MRKLGGIMLIAALALTACSASTEELAPGTLIDDGPSPTQSATADITAAPIPAQTQTEPTEGALSGEFGDPATDAAYLERIKESWRGDAPSEDALIGAAKYACDELAAGTPWMTIRPVGGTTDDELENALSITAWAGRTYCTDYNPDNL